MLIHDTIIKLIAVAITTSIILSAIGRLAISLAKAYAIIKKANHKDQLIISSHSEVTIGVNELQSLAPFLLTIITRLY